MKAGRALLGMLLVGLGSGCAAGSARSAPAGAPGAASLGAQGAASEPEGSARAAGLELGLAPSFLPNLGLAASLAVPLGPESPWRLEARFTDQFLDDKAFADSRFPEAGDWTQLDLGLLRLGPEDEGRAWSTRFGLTGFQARGEPNLAEEPGDYLGLYLGLGRFTRFGAGLVFGPELTLLVATGPDPLVLVPQLTWGLRWTPGAR